MALYFIAYFVNFANNFVLMFGNDCIFVIAHLVLFEIQKIVNVHLRNQIEALYIIVSTWRLGGFLVIISLHFVYIYYYIITLILCIFQH